MWDQWKKTHIAYALTILFEELEYKGVVSRQEKNNFYEVCGKTCGLLDLLPRYMISPTRRQPPLPTKLRRSLDMATTPGSHQGLIIYRQKDVIPPDAYLKLILSEYNTCNGQCLVENKTVSVIHDNSSTDLDTLKQVLKDFPDESIFFFGKADTNYHKDDLQPFEILHDKDKKCILACVIEGDINDNYKHDEGTHSRAFYAVNEYIIEKIKDTWEMHSEIMENLVKVIHTKIFQRDITNLFKTRGTVYFITNTGEFLNISKNKDSMGFDNGAWWTSNALGFTGEEEQAPTQTQEPVPAISAAERRRQMLAAKGHQPVAGAVTSPPASSQVPASSQKTEQPQIVPDLAGKEMKESVLSNKTSVPVTKADLKSSTAAPDPEQTTTLHDDGIVECPYKKADQENHRQSWMYRNFDLPKNKQGKPTLPNDWKTCKGLPASMLKKDSKLKERIKSLDMLGVIKESVAKGIEETPCYIISPTEREIAKKILGDYDLSETSKILTQEQFDTIHNAAATFPEQLGKPIELMVYVPIEEINKLVRTTPKAATALIMTFQKIIGTYLQDELSVELEKMRKEYKETLKKKPERIVA